MKFKGFITNETENNKRLKEYDLRRNEMSKRSRHSVKSSDSEIACQIVAIELEDVKCLKTRRKGYS